MAFRRGLLALSGFVFILFFASFKITKSGLNTDGYNHLALTFDYTATTPLLNPPFVSGVIEDPTDPAANLGIVVDVKENNKDLSSSDYDLTVSSDNPLIVHNDKLSVTKSNGQATIKIIPSGFGYSNITLTLKKGKETTTLVINYAASNLSEFPNNTFWHTGISDASTAIALDDDYMIVADDEINQLYVYHRNQSGLPVSVFNYANMVGLTDGEPGNYKEIDCEAGTRSLKHPERFYWTGSMGNGGKSFKEKPNRSCLFATDITGTGASTKFSYAGAYNNLKRQLIKWGNNQKYKFSAAAESGQTPKRVGGFNIEGIAFAPDSTTLYIGFRAPIVPVTNRTKALIAPIENFEAWFNNGHPKGEPVIGQPIELSLGGRGIRDIAHLSDGTYVIVAGNSDEILNGALYTWSGNPTDAPVLANIMEVYALKAEGYMEVTDKGKPTGKVQIISDNGSSSFYNDGLEAKFLNTNLRKFRSDIVNLHEAHNQ